jgi:hypothetical protein
MTIGSPRSSPCTSPKVQTITLCKKELELWTEDTSDNNDCYLSQQAQLFIAVPAVTYCLPGSLLWHSCLPGSQLSDKWSWDPTRDGGLETLHNFVEYICIGGIRRERNGGGAIRHPSWSSKRVMPRKNIMMLSSDRKRPTGRTFLRKTLISSK